MLALSFIIKNRYIIILTILLSTIGLLYSYNKKLKNEIQDKIIEQKMLYQNYQAYQDSINQLPDSIQIYHSFIRELNNTIKSKDETITLIGNRITILNDSIRFYQDNINDVVVDNQDNDSISYTISINEENDLVTVNGFAKIYSILNVGSYKLDIDIKPFDIINYLEFSFEDSSIVSYTKINGYQSIRAVSEVSPYLYSLLIRNIEKGRETAIKRLSYGIDLNILTTDCKRYDIRPELFINYNIWNEHNYKIKLNGLLGFDESVFVGFGIGLEL